jgi:hypothetical protein
MIVSTRRRPDGMLKPLPDDLYIQIMQPVRNAR